MKRPPHDPNADVVVAGRYKVVKHDANNPAPKWPEYRRQTKLASAVEAVVNTVVGLLVAFAAQAAICWAYSIPLSWEDNAIIVWWMTGVSVFRSYIIRRIWNSEFWRKRGH